MTNTALVTCYLTVVSFTNSTLTIDGGRDEAGRTWTIYREAWRTNTVAVIGNAEGTRWWTNILESVPGPFIGVRLEQALSIGPDGFGGNGYWSNGVWYYFPTPAITNAGPPLPQKMKGIR